MFNSTRLICLVAILSFLVAPALAAKFNKVVEINQQAPEFKDLPGIDGQRHSLADFKESKLVVVIFLRNNCPIAQAYEERIRDFVTKYRDKQVTLVGINVSLLDGEGLEQMTARAREHKWDFPYLRDASQKTGKAYGATNTPHLFVLDQERRIAYMGAIDDNNKPDQVEENYLVDAVEALLAGRKVDTRETLQRGCQIEYQDK